jgi:uncharacterized protein (DUF433 family)
MTTGFKRKRRDKSNEGFKKHPIFTLEVYIVRRIIADPEILGGKPIVEGTRLSVAHILGLLSHGMSHAAIVDAYPDLTVEDVNAVVQYAAAALHNDVLIEVKSTREAE